jgi:hypothetical protein
MEVAYLKLLLFKTAECLSKMEGNLNIEKVTAVIRYKV